MLFFLKLGLCFNQKPHQLSMKNSILILFVVLAFSACQQKNRYTQQSSEIEAVKALFEVVESGDFEAQRIYYADSALIYYNATEENPTTMDEMIAQQKKEQGEFTNVSVTLEDNAIEMVTTDEGETWVNTWGVWEATHVPTGKTFKIPFHETFQFVDGKIVKDFGYWDNAPIATAIMEFEKSQAAASDTTAMEQ